MAQKSADVILNNDRIGKREIEDKRQKTKDKGQ
jgi:hypothetical protein